MCRHCVSLELSRSLPIVAALNLVSNDRFRRDIMLGAGTWKRVLRRNDTSVLANAFVVAPEFLVDFNGQMELLNQHVVEEEKRQSGCARAAAAAIIDRALSLPTTFTRLAAARLRL